jgi:CelD/BcsL family acetyltransferase involved in cellulose biosynthesis
MEIRVEWVEAEPWPSALEAGWNGLLERCPEATIFLSPEWAGAWGRHSGERLRLLGAWRGERLVGLAPMAERVERRFGVPMRMLAFAGDPLADRHGLLFDPEEAAAATRAMAEALARASRAVGALVLSEIATGTATEEALESAAAAQRIPRTERTTSRAPIVRLDRPWDEVARSFSKSLRIRLDRARKRQAEAGGLHFRRWQPKAEEVDALVARFRAIEEKSWKGDRGVGIFAPARVAFFRDVAARFARREWLDVATLSAGDRLVAYRFGFRFRGVFLDYNLAHDPEDDRLSPGRTLLDDIVRDSHRIGLAAVDASRGRIAPPHLLADWTPESRWHKRRVWFGASAPGRLLALWERSAKPAVRRALGRGPREEPA